MNNIHGVATDKIQVGDRVEVRGCGEESYETHWGTVIEEHGGGNGLRVHMDNPNLPAAKKYETSTGAPCYYAWWADITKHTPAMVEDERGPVHEGEVNTEPNPLQKVIDSLTATHLYLEQVTGKKYSAHLKGFDLESDNGYDSNTVTIKFVVEER